jgi:hypothetical protein
VETHGLQKIHGAERVDFKIEDGDIASLVVRGLSSTMDNEIEAVGTEKRFQPDSIADVQIMVSEVPGDAAKPIEIPGRITGRSEKDLAHIVIYAKDLMPLPIKVLDRFGTNQPTGAGNQDFHCGHCPNPTF